MNRNVLALLFFLAVVGGIVYLLWFKFRPVRPVYYTRLIEEPSDECDEHGCSGISGCVPSTFKITDIPMEERTLLGIGRWLRKHTNPRNCNENTDKKYYVRNRFGALDHPKVKNDGRCDVSRSGCSDTEPERAAHPFAAPSRSAQSPSR